MSDAKAAAGELRLQWRHTWDEKGPDYSGRLPDYPDPIGRIYLIQQGPQEGRWFWSMTAHGPDISRSHKCSGQCDTPREAALKVEAAWFAAIVGTSHERPVNEYQSAKARQ